MAKKIKMVKADSIALYSRAAHMGMVEAHGQHTRALNDKMNGMKRGNSRRSEFSKQVQTHLDASREHFSKANAPSGTEPGGSFEANESHLAQRKQRKYN